MYQVWAGIQIAAAVVSFCLLIAVVALKPSQVQKYLLCAVFCVVLYSLGNALEVTSETKVQAIRSLKIEYLGISMFSLFYMLFLDSYGRIRIPFQLLAVYGLMAFVVLGAALTCEQHPLYYSSIEFVETGSFPRLRLGKGPFYLLQVFYNATAIPGALIRGFRKYKSMPPSMDKWNYRRFLFAAAAPFFGFQLGILGWIYGLDPIPAGLCAGVLFMLVTVYRRHLLDVVSYVREDMVERMENALIVVDRRKTFLNANQAAIRLFPELGGIRRGQALPPDLEDLLIGPEEGKELKRQERFYRYYVSRICRQQEIEGYSILLVDLTETKRQMDELERLRREADQANEAKSRFLARVSHELRTPMNAIVGYTDLLLQEQAREKAEAYANQIQAASSHLLTLINELLDISRSEVGKAELAETEYEFRALLIGLVSVIRPGLQEKGLELRTEWAQDLPEYLMGDSGRIRQVLLNLLGNAVKYTETGSVIFRADCRKKMGNDCEGQVELRFEVEDTGIGIRTDEMRTVFELFGRGGGAEEKGVEGSGLGLPIVRAALKELGGELEVNSRFGEGSLFRVKIPQKLSYLVREAEPKEISDRKKEGSSESLFRKTNLSRDGRNREADPPFDGSNTVLVVDDNKANRAVLCELLKRAGIHADMAANGQEAVERASESAYDLILMDQMMPGMDGTAAMRQIRLSAGGSVRIVALTADVVAGSEERLLSAGFDGYLAKPVTYGRLLELVRRLLAQQPDAAERVRVRRPETGGFPVAVSYEKGLELCEGDRGLYLWKLKLFADYVPEQVEICRRLLKEGDYDGYTVEIHALKGNLLGIGAEETAKKAKEQEQAGKAGKVHEILAGSGEILKELCRIAEEIREYLKRYQSEIKGPELP